MQIIAEEVQKKQRDCEEDLVKAEPALIAAQVFLIVHNLQPIKYDAFLSLLWLLFYRTHYRYRVSLNILE